MSNSARREGMARANLDKRSKRPGQKQRRRGNEIRQRRVNFVIAAREIMSHLVREENREQRSRERDTFRNQAWIREASI